MSGKLSLSEKEKTEVQAAASVAYIQAKLNGNQVLLNYIIYKYSSYVYINNYDIMLVCTKQ